MVKKAFGHKKVDTSKKSFIFFPQVFAVGVKCVTLVSEVRQCQISTVI